MQVSILKNIDTNLIFILGSNGLIVNSIYQCLVKKRIYISQVDLIEKVHINNNNITKDFIDFYLSYLHLNVKEIYIL